MKTYIPDVYTRGEAPLREAMIACPGGAWLFQTPGKISADRTPEVDVVNYVTKDTAPIFFYHCRYDECVPVKNTWMLASKLDELGLPFELHIFGSGHHGMSVNNRLTEANEPIDSSVTQWVPLCISWLDKVFEVR